MLTYITANSKLVDNIFTTGTGVVVVLGTEATSFNSNFKLDTWIFESVNTIL